ncbi:hypothetical protein BH11ARM2_BH11ARM2_03000 [soil metagenome]
MGPLPICGKRSQEVRFRVADCLSPKGAIQTLADTSG